MPANDDQRPIGEKNQAPYDAHLGGIQGRGATTDYLADLKGIRTKRRSP
jgi:hypothetical protein